MKECRLSGVSSAPAQTADLGIRSGLLAAFVPARRDVVARPALDLVAFAGKARHTLSPMSEITVPLSRISRVTSMQPAGIVNRFAFDMTE